MVICREWMRGEDAWIGLTTSWPISRATKSQGERNQDLLERTFRKSKRRRKLAVNKKILAEKPNLRAALFAFEITVIESCNVKKNSICLGFEVSQCFVVSGILTCLLCKISVNVEDHFFIMSWDRPYAWGLSKLSKFIICNYKRFSAFITSDVKD